MSETELRDAEVEVISRELTDEMNRNLDLGKRVAELEAALMKADEQLARAENALAEYRARMYGITLLTRP